MYKLLVYLLDNDLAYPVHEYLDTDHDNLATLGSEHMTNNPSYVSIIISYKAESVSAV